MNYRNNNKITEIITEIVWHINPKNGTYSYLWLEIMSMAHKP